MKFRFTRKGYTMKLTLHEQLLAATFAGIIAIFSQIIIPLGIVPLSLQTFIVGLTVTLLGRKVGIWSVLIYFLLGAIGLPVFAGGGSGVGYLLGPTGGFLVGFIFASLIIGTIIKYTGYAYFSTIVANLLGFIVALFFGTIWLKFAADMNWTPAISTGFFGFLFPEIIKAIASGWLSVVLIRRLPQRFLSNG